MEETCNNCFGSKKCSMTHEVDIFKGYKIHFVSFFFNLTKYEQVMLKLFRRVSSNKGNKYDNLEKKNDVVSKFGRIAEDNVLKNILKLPADMLNLL